ncbi:MAG: alanyl-tRNA editing protein, partial [Rhodospirillales bacterium]|nr:alanyl-tRNA editing protein [Rhodospirillales bacterium]
MTERLFLDQPALARTTATVKASDPAGIVLDRTVFYARSGGQPGDVGVLRWDGGETPIADTVKGEGETILHLPAEGAPLPPVGAVVEAAIDWDRRHRLMRMHTAMHLLCSLIKGAAVTGGSVGADRSRLDFDLPAPPPKEEIE